MTGMGHGAGPDGGHDEDTVCVVAASSAWPFYRATGAYVCQPQRRFRDSRWLGFYSARTIHGLVARIEHVVPVVRVDHEEAARRCFSLDPVERRVGEALAAHVHEGGSGDAEVVLLSLPDSPMTQRIGDLTHRGRSAWTMFQRYETLGRLRAASDTAELGDNGAD